MIASTGPNCWCGKSSHAGNTSDTSRLDLFGFDDGRCDRALPAADFDGLDVRWSAELAALGDVTLAGALRCDNALPAANFDVPVDSIVEDAARPADVLVTLALAILASWLNVNRIELV
ncbi:MAG: hypothetical protein ACREVK_02505 [Gammaproteobacteria bacterium]